jgi:hypothetical protein
LTPASPGHPLPQTLLTQFAKQSLGSASSSSSSPSSSSLCCRWSSFATVAAPRTTSNESLHPNAGKKIVSSLYAKYRLQRKSQAESSCVVEHTRLRGCGGTRLKSPPSLTAPLKKGTALGYASISPAAARCLSPFPEYRVHGLAILIRMRRQYSMTTAARPITPRERSAGQPMY